MTGIRIHTGVGQQSTMLCLTWPNNRKERFSIVWQYMTAVDSIFAVCDTCQKKLSYKTSLTNLKKHLKAVHGINITEKVDKVDRERERTPDVDNVVNSSGLTDLVPISSYTTSSGLTAHVPISSNTASSSLTTIPPISTFTSSASTSTLKRKQPSIANFLPRKITPDRFKKFVNLLNPNYSLPTRQAISKTLIPLEYQKCVFRVEELIEKEVDNVCLTTDCWTSRCNESYIAVTAHFVNKEFILKSVLIECTEITERHTSVNLSNEIKAIITKWKLDGKFVLVVSDNASNIKNAINNLQIRHLGCFAHTINLVVEEGLKCESDLINKVKTIVTHFRKSTIANKILEKNQINSGIKDPKKLIQAVNTRWNSVFYMLERFILLENSIRSSLGLFENPPSSLTAVEWIVVKELCIVLRPFESATKVVSGETYMTASMILPIVNVLTDVCSKMKNKPEFDSRTHEVVNSISNAMKNKNSWGNIYLSKTLAKCTFLDPRFKSILFSPNPSFSENIKMEITDEFTSIIQHIRSKNTANILTPHNNEQEHQEPFVENQGNEFSIWGSLDVHFLEHKIR
ncbi:zinc finger BED domain-containing protein 6-like [Myzus persicae]|uniref:zinc finger BED domain-containing protein 6-like n=1 Tax=Myzus persicae TaxID=13164 RepID=UPI000B932B4E|nr:zinc finger BED domain-containing protein 6-like [Myzus persicae]